MGKIIPYAIHILACSYVNKIMYKDYKHVSAYLNDMCYFCAIKFIQIKKLTNKILKNGNETKTAKATAAK
jgi:hypothetical protein